MDCPDNALAARFLILINLKGKIMKKSLLSALYICAAFCLSVGTASAADIKVGIIDTTRIVTESKAGKSAQVVFNQELETKNAAYAAKGNELQTIQEELATKSSEMTLDEYNEKSAKYSKVKKELERMKNDMEEDLSAKNEELNLKLFTEIAAIVSDYCKKENFTIILEKNYVAAYDGAIDVTDKIIELYDATK